jgi:hypothetical protein
MPAKKPARSEKNQPKSIQRTILLLPTIPSRRKSGKGMNGLDGLFNFELGRKWSDSS